MHAETYSLIIDAEVKDSAEKEKMLKAINTNEAVKLKASWVEKYCRNEELTFAQRSIAFVCVEIFFLCGSFAVLFYLKNRNSMHGKIFSNELIARDERSHVRSGCTLHKMLLEQVTDDFIREIIESAVIVEKDFWKAVLPAAILGIKCLSMSLYIEYIADQLLLMLNLTKVFETPCFFDFMVLGELEGKSNLFERRVGDYRQARINDPTRFEFDTSAEF